MSYDEDYGPDFYNDNAKTYEGIVADYTYGPRPDDIKKPWPDFIEVGYIDGMKYYTPNNEDWGPIIVMDHEAKLADSTGFYEMDDMEYEGSDYKFVRYGGKLVPLFTVPVK